MKKRGNCILERNFAKNTPEFFQSKERKAGSYCSTRLWTNFFMIFSTTPEAGEKGKTVIPPKNKIILFLIRNTRV